MGYMTTKTDRREYQCDECKATSWHYPSETKRSSRLRCLQCGSYAMNIKQRAKMLINNMIVYIDERDVNNFIRKNPTAKKL